MGATGSELKRVRQSLRNNLRNRHYKTMMKTVIKKVLQTKSKDDALSQLNKANATIDRVCGKGVIHKNRANQHKSKLNKYVNNL